MAKHATCVAPASSRGGWGEHFSDRLPKKYHIVSRFVSYIPCMCYVTLILNSDKLVAHNYKHDYGRIVSGQIRAPMGWSGEKRELSLRHHLCVFVPMRFALNDREGTTCHATHIEDSRCAHPLSDQQKRPQLCRSSPCQ